MNCHFDRKPPRFLRLERRNLQLARSAVVASGKLEVSPLRDDEAVAPVEMTHRGQGRRQGGSPSIREQAAWCKRSTAKLVVTFTLHLACALLPTAIHAESFRNISHAEFTRDVLHLQEVVTACRASASACSATVVPDEKVSAEGPAPAFTEHWDWLRATLEKAAKAPAPERAVLMDQAGSHLGELATETEAAAKPPSEASFNAARAKAGEILARPAFQHADGPTWWQRQVARIYMWFGSLFEGASRIGAALPWLGTLLEWTFFLLAAAGLLLFIRRSFVRQQLQVTLNQSSSQLSIWDRESADWARDAETHAAAQEWREAVHCLYWAAIVRLEARRAWRHNPARTPREYVRLLKAGSPQQSALRGLTGIFERVWYGLREADSADYGRARGLFDNLSSSSPDSALSTALPAEAAQ